MYDLSILKLDPKVIVFDSNKSKMGEETPPLNMHIQSMNLGTNSKISQNSQLSAASNKSNLQKQVAYKNTTVIEGNICVCN